MILSGKSLRNGATVKRSRAPRAGLEPRFGPRLAALVRESWWLLIVAGFMYLALILGSYRRSDPSWSFSGTGETIANKGGVIGAWLSDLLLYLFGFSAWWWVAAGVILVVCGYRRLTKGIPPEDAHHPWLAVPGFVLVLVSSSALEALRLYRLPVTLPQASGGAVGDALGQTLARAFGFNGATLLLIVSLAIGLSLFTRVSWLKQMERVGTALERLYNRLLTLREERRDRQLGAVALEEREHKFEIARMEIEDREPVLVVPAVVEVEKSSRVVREKQKPLFVDMPDSPLPPLALLEDATVSQELVSAETL